MTTNALAAPTQQCDPIMQGGITSGVVYPPAIPKIAPTSRFRSIGGTSGCRMTAIFFEPYAAADAGRVIKLFRASIRSIAARDYGPAQIRGWSGVVDGEQFARRCASKSTWVAKIEHRVAGFCDFEPDGHVDLPVRSPGFSTAWRSPCPTQHVEKSARDLDLARLYTEASITARPAFEASGYRVIVAQTVTVRGESMTNYRMEKRLDDQPTLQIAF